MKTLWSIALLVGLFNISQAHSQATKSEMERFGDIGLLELDQEYTFPDGDQNGMVHNITVEDYAVLDFDSPRIVDSFAFLHLKNIAPQRGRQRGFIVTPSFGSLALIPPRSPDGGDACTHTHLSFGIWLGYRAIKSDPPPVRHLSRTFYEFVMGGSMSGKRNDAGDCIHSTTNNLVTIHERYGWGEESGFTYAPEIKSIRGYSLPTAFMLSQVPRISLMDTISLSPVSIVIGVSAPTHGWGTCEIQFCFEPVNLRITVLEG